MAHIATATAPASRPVTTFGKRTRLERSAISMVCAAAYCAIVSCDSPDKSENVFDFGIARQGASISKTIVFENRTDKDVVLTEVKSDCGCTVAGVTSNTLVPSGKSLPVPITLDLKSKSSRVSASIALIFDEKSQNVVYTITGILFDEYPETVDFGNVRRGSGERREFILKPFPGQAPVKILTCEMPPAYGVVSYAPSEENKNAQLITLVVAENPPYGYFNVPMTITTNEAEVPKKPIWVTGYVLSDLELTSRELVFGRLGSPGPSQDIDLWSPEGKPVRLLRVENTREGVFAHQVLEQSEKDHQPIRIVPTGKVPADVKSGIVRGLITFWADVGGVEKKDRVEVYASI